MIALPYLAWIADPDEAFNPDVHARNDYPIFSGELVESEGVPATLAVDAINPLDGSGKAFGLLAPGRPRYALYSVDFGDGPQLQFRGELTAIPADIGGLMVKLEFIAQPADTVEQKASVAAGLRVAPWYMAELVPPEKRADDDLVLDAYSALWHYHPTTHAITTTQFLQGEDGTEVFAVGEHQADKFATANPFAPLDAVDGEIAFNWTQRAAGELSFSNYLLANWPGASGGSISSFTMTQSSMPQVGASLGPGWTVKQSGSAKAPPDLQVRQKTDGGTTIVKWWDGDTTQLTSSSSEDYVENIPPGSILISDVTIKDETKATYHDIDGLQRLSSLSNNTEKSGAIIVCNQIDPSLTAAYNAERRFTERVRFSLVADVQRVRSNQTERERLDNLSTVDLSMPIGDALLPPIGDPRRRSFASTARGGEVIENGLLRARARLRRRARCLEITFAPLDWSRVTAITLRKDAQLYDNRLPGGVATGKIFRKRFKVTGGDNPGVEFEVTIGCAVGNGGTVEGVAGDGVWASDDYIAADSNYQQRVGQTVPLSTGDVGFSPVPFNPQDDGIDFISGFTAADAMAQDLEVTNHASEQAAQLAAVASQWGSLAGVTDPNTIAARAQAINQKLMDVATTAKLKLKPLNASFEWTVDVTVTPLKLPKQIDLAAS